ncbi:hypothetical protein Brsp05_03277 [Brucella sp. NBRC 12953]
MRNYLIIPNFCLKYLEIGLVPPDDINETASQIFNIRYRRDY